MRRDKEDWIHRGRERGRLKKKIRGRGGGEEERGGGGGGQEKTSGDLVARVLEGKENKRKRSQYWLIPAPSPPTDF